MNTDVGKGRKWPRALGLIVVFLLGVLLGWLLAPRCPQCPSSGGGDGTVTGNSSASRGKGTPSTVGTGSGTANTTGGSSTASGDVKSGGTGGNGSGTGDDASGGGHGDGTTGSGSGELEKSSEADAHLAGAAVAMADGRSPLGVPTNISSAPPPVTGKVLSAPDFSYDKTGLPRYPQAVQRVSSAVSYRDPNNTSDYGTSAAIVTSDPFDTVVQWYQDHLPSGWHAQSSGDFAQLAQQLSPQNLMRMLSGGAPDDAPGKSATSPAERIQLSIFDPPPGAADKPAIMIVKRGEERVTIMLKAHSVPSN